MLPQRVTSYTLTQTWTSPHVFLTHTRTFAQQDLLSISHTNMTLTEFYKAFVVMHVIQWDLWQLRKIRMKPGKEQRVGYPLVYVLYTFWNFYEQEKYLFCNSRFWSSSTKSPTFSENQGLIRVIPVGVFSRRRQNTLDGDRSTIRQTFSNTNPNRSAEAVQI